MNSKNKDIQLKEKLNKSSLSKQPALLYDPHVLKVQYASNKLISLSMPENKAVLNHHPRR